MKSLITVVAAVAVLSLFNGCSDDNPPGVHVSNQRANKANVQIKQADGNTINHNDVAPGATSNLQEIVEGAILVTAGIQNESVSPMTTLNASKNNNYTIVILDGDPPTLRVDTKGN